jgi:diguanylate cyclase (GGDEF)-like protein
MDLQQSERLLTYLKNTPLLDGYCLSIYSSSSQDTITGHLCSTRGIPHLCHKICQPYLNVSINEALSTKKPVFFLCPLGLFSFAVPVSTSSCLVCSGLRENLFDLYFYRSEQLEFLKEKNVYPFEILEQLEKLPVSTEKDVRETMLKVANLVASFTADEMMQSVDSSTYLQNTFMDVAASIGRAESFDKAVALFSEMFGILFDIPAIALVLKDEESDNFIIETSWGSSPASSYPYIKVLPFQEQEYVPVFLTTKEIGSLFPGNKAASATCLPLFESTELFGMAVLFDTSLSSLELSLCEILTSRFVCKIKENYKDRETWRKQRVVRLLEMVRTLVLTENQDDLLHLIVAMAAELVDASSGSLMILDNNSKILRVVSALGMNPVLARSLSTKKGEGIAGMVAATGTPLLVTDIEQEPYFGRPNRKRFGTKSCISLPLQFKGTTIGVLNLADKKNSAPFILPDQEILGTFLEQATIILGRSTALRKARLNSITDPLTGLYNMRFLKKRLNEELSRSIRHNLHLTLIIVRLENLTRHQGVKARAHTQWVVKKMAQILTASLRDIDLVGRSSEVEFCLVLPATPKKEGAFVAERIARAIKVELAKDNDSSDRQSLHISTGIAFFPEDGASSADLIKAARNAIFQRDAEAGGKSALPLSDLTARAASL